MGTHFKAPKRSDDKAWEAIEMLYAAGVRYDVFDWHVHYWPEKYKESGQDFESYFLGQVLADIGISLPPASDQSSEQAIRAVITPRYRPHETQWRGPRPTHPRDVPEFLKWWREQNLDRIAIAVEACEALGVEPPQGLRGELLLDELKKRLGEHRDAPKSASRTSKRPGKKRVGYPHFS